MRNAAIPLLAVLLSLLGSLALAQPPRAEVTRVEVGPPDNAIQRMFNPSFEEPIGFDPTKGWDIHRFSERVDYVSIDGEWSLRQGHELGVWSEAYQLFDFRDCVSDVWFYVCWQVRTTEPPSNGEKDICELNLYDERRLWIAELVYATNLDATNPPSWKCDWYRVLNLGDFEEVALFVGAYHSHEHPSDCLWDDFSAWCVMDTPFKVYVPTFAADGR